MNRRRFFGILLLTCWIPIACGISVARWFSRQESSRPEYESTATLTSAEWKKYGEDAAVLTGMAPVGGNPILGASYSLKSPAMAARAREAMGLGEANKKNLEVRIETTEFSLGPIGVRVVGPDPAVVQAYLKELLNQYSLWLKKVADDKHGEVVKPIIEGILELRKEMAQLDEKLRPLEGGDVQNENTADLLRLKQERDAALKRHTELEARLEAEDSKVGKPKEPFTIRDGPTAPTRVKVPMSEAVLWGELVGAGVGVVLVLIALMTSRARPSQVRIP